MGCLYIYVLVFFLPIIAFCQLHNDTIANNSEKYIIVFKPEATHVAIRNHITRLMDTGNGAGLSYSSIGQFRWMSSTTDPSQSKLLHAEQDVVHYWVKDTHFKLQDYVQNRVPSWVSLQHEIQSASAFLKHGYLFKGLDRIDQRSGLDSQYHFPSSQVRGSLYHSFLSVLLLLLMLTVHIAYFLGGRGHSISTRYRR